MTDILIERHGALGLITMNRPDALNTLSLEMYRRFEPALIEWAADPAVRAIAVRGAGDRAFCAGGDVVAIYEAKAAGVDLFDANSDFFREEYRLIRRIHRLQKPYVALMNGVTMGGGAGVAVNGRYRIASERTIFAMPEVHIALFPDVGATRFLNLLPGRIGLFLALTGKRIFAPDMLALGLATHVVRHRQLGELATALTEAATSEDAASAVEAALARFAIEPTAPPLLPLQPAIDRAFAGDGVEAIVANLEREEGAWAKEARDAIARASPISLKITFHQLRIGRGFELEAALAMEYRITQRVLAGHDFFEGIRALLIDKDRTPHWEHSSLEAVTQSEVERYFAPLGARELVFDR